MQIIIKYQNELYAAALSLTGNAEKSKKAVIKAFEKVLRAYHSDTPETRVELYKNLFGNISFLSVSRKKLDKAGIINGVKHSLSLFDKKVFVLKYEANFTVIEIASILGSSTEKIKKSLLKSTKKVADSLEDSQNEL